MSDNEKQVLLESLIKKHPNSTIEILSNFTSVTEFIPTGAMMLDNALCNGGLPMGRLIEIVGCQGSAKTTLCNGTILNTQKKGYDCLFLDAEWAYNKEFAIDVMGVNPDKLYIARPSSGEEAIDLIVDFIDACPKLKLIVLDSISSIDPIEEIEKDGDDPEKIGNHARLVNKMLKKIIPLCGAKDIMFIAINQLRNTIGYAPIPTGGKRLECAKAVSIEVKAASKIEDSKIGVIGREFDFNIKKNKFGFPFVQGTFSLRWGKEPVGFDNINDVMNLAIKAKLIKNNGGWYKYEELNLRKSELYDFFLGNPDEFERLLKGCI